MIKVATSGWYDTCWRESTPPLLCATMLIRSTPKRAARSATKAVIFLPLSATKPFLSTWMIRKAMSSSVSVFTHADWNQESALPIQPCTSMTGRKATSEPAGGARASQSTVKVMNPSDCGTTSPVNLNVISFGTGTHVAAHNSVGGGSFWPAHGSAGNLSVPTGTLTV